MRKLGLCLAVLLLLGSVRALDRQPNTDYHARREALVKKAGGVIVVVAPLEKMDAVYGFRQEDNFYYLSGITVPGAALLISPAAEAQGQTPARSYTEILFLPPRNLRLEKFTGPQLGADDPDASKITGFDRVEEMGKLPDEVTNLLANGRPIVYTELPGYGERSPSSEALDFLRHSTAMVFFQDIRQMITAQRTVKDAGEIAVIRKAVDASVAAHLAAMKAVKPNVKEYEISALMDYEWERRGCERASYSPIVGSGHNSTVLHYSENTNTMKSGDVVVIDAAAEYSMYAADITRTLPVNGHFTPRQKEIYEIVLGAQEAAAAAFQPGKSMLVGDGENSLNKVARDYIKSHGKDLHGQPLDQYFIHGLGHYLGLNVHDPGDYKVPLGPGMVFTIEPGIYIPKENIGVRIEDDYLVDSDGKLIKLSAALPSKPEEVEKVMAVK
ncbi:MAG TPA: aminopeptidase P N-terminal domain-containing protein [Candidatus Sulfotelmatobacter sp.]|nr:aminopeptidase P N-terminal domain-containing protein [Candidatus Sulfotelmatobacter sp.]